jgi:fructose/tagatose bisphosphate aldolase
MNMNEVSEKLKERKMKLEQELGNYLGIEFESDYSNQKKTGIVTVPNESRAFREFRQIRQSMATEGRKNNK